MGERTSLRFGIKVLLAWLAGWASLALWPDLERAAIDLTVRHLAALLRLAGGAQVVSGTSLFALGTSITIVSECTSVAATVLLVGAVLAYPTSWRWKAVGWVLGVAALWVYNLARVIGLLVVLVRWPAAFDFVHIYLWQTLTLAITGGLFAIWSARAPRPVES
jgi:exosortase/archaeosortase family protein